MADTALWTADELQNVTGGQMCGQAVLPIRGVSIDSRSVCVGDLFVAIKGDRVDGHDYIGSAFRNGAGLALVSRARKIDAKKHCLLTVDGDPLDALVKLGRAARQRSAAQVIAVTGSVGKTSTKEMLRATLAPSGDTHASVASYNNHWGVPLTLARLSREATYGVFEIGMNHAGEITPLVAMVQPHVAVVTNVAASHLGHFRSLDEIADAKAEIFSGVVRGGAAVINRDSDYYGILQRTAMMFGIENIVSFGKHGDATVRLEQIVLRPEGSSITVSVFGETIAYKLGLPGEHMAINSLAVLAAAKLANADMARAVLSLANLKPARGRGGQEKFQTASGEITLLDESYNANPASMRAAIKLLTQIPVSKGARRVAVLGDMLELGEFGLALHSELADVLGEAKIDVVHAVGPLMQEMWVKLPKNARGQHAATSALLVEHIFDDVRDGDVVMVKGSLGSKMAVLAEAFRVRFGDANRNM